MKKLNGNNLLIVHPNKIYFETFVQEAEEIGAIAHGANTLDEAKIKCQNFDFDLIICYHTLVDGTAMDLVEWIEQADLDIKFISMGSPVGMEKLFQLKFPLIISEKLHFSVVLEIVHKELLNINSFNEHIDTETFESSIYYNKNKLMVETVELNADSVSLSFDEELTIGAFVSLRLSVFNKGKFENHIFLCSFKEQLPTSKRFEIFHTHLPAWSKFLEQMEKKQKNIHDFLKKASGL